MVAHKRNAFDELNMDNQLYIADKCTFQTNTAATVA